MATKCTKIVCGDGYALNDDNECEKKRAAKSAASKPATSRRDDGRQNRPPAEAAAKSTANSSGARASSGVGQIDCDDLICRPVKRGCHLEYRGGGGYGADANAAALFWFSCRCSFGRFHVVSVYDPQRSPYHAVDNCPRLAWTHINRRRLEQPWQYRLVKSLLIGAAH